jgi:hypothetical protein
MAYQGLSYELQAVMPEALATGLFTTTLCTIQVPSGNLGPSGAPDGLFVNVAGLVRIKCMSAPPSSARIQATDVKSLEEIMNLELRHVLMDGYHPNVVSTTQSGGRALMETFDVNGALVDTTAYDILGAEADSQIQMTRMELKFASI